MSDLNQFNAFLRRLDDRLTQVESMATQMKVQGNLPASLPGQYKGKPIPSIESCEITIPATTVRQSGNIVLAADGPFMARAIHFAWRPTAGQYPGRWRPVASSRDGDLANSDDLIDFYWEYQVTGSHRNRQNAPVPSAVVERGEAGNGYFDFLVEDAIQASCTITIAITPSVAPTNAGVLWVGFSGMYILG